MCSRCVCVCVIVLLQVVIVKDGRQKKGATVDAKGDEGWMGGERIKYQSTVGDD